MDKNVQNAINNQINKEFAASYFYLAMAAYLDTHHFDGFAKWMEAQSDEERAHGQRLLRYLLDRGGEVDLRAIEKPPGEFGTVHDVFVDSLRQEKENTAAIYEIYALACEAKDYATQAHMQWFIDEQVEEEKTVSDILGRLELAGDEKTALLILDSEMGKRFPEEPNPTA